MSQTAYIRLDISNKLLPMQQQQLLKVALQRKLHITPWIMLCKAKWSLILPGDATVKRSSI